MATWKKVIVSGSGAHLSSVTASAAVQVGTNQYIGTTQATTYLTGSFTGSFRGDGSGLTGVTATFPAVQLTPLLTTSQVFVNDGSNNRYSTVSQFNSSSWAGVSGDILINPSTGVATIQADSVALGTDTSGNYVASVANGTGITAIAAASEGAAVTVSVSGASSLNTNKVTKWTGTAFADSTITDDGTTVTIAGNLQVNGTTTTVNTTNLTVTDQFILLGSGSATNKDGGIIVQSAAAAGSGFAFAYDDTTDRWYFQDALSGTATSLSAISYTTTAAAVAVQRDAAANRPADGTGPLYGGTNGWGNMWIDSDSNNDIWIYV